MTQQMRNLYPHVLAALTSRPWAIHEATMSTILSIMELRADGLRWSPEEIEARLEAAQKSNGPRKGGGRSANVAVVPVYGVITPRAGNMATSGSSTAESIRNDFRAAMADEDVDSIVFDVDSPGGVVDGLPELFDEIYSARGRKPMTAVANTQMASGALWIAAAADRIVASPSATVGSIGVIGVHQDKSEKYAKDGIRHTIIKTSPYKGEGHDSSPLSEDAQAHMLSEAMEYDDMFAGALAQARGVAVESVRSDYGQGRMLTAKRALSAGLIDGIETLESAVQSSALTAMGGGGSYALDFEHVLEIEDAIDVTSHSSASSVETWLPSVRVVVNGDGSVLSSAVQREALATELPFADRLRLATAELEAVVGIARDRATRRLDDGRPLSSGTIEHLGRLRAALEELVTVTPEAPQEGRVTSAASLDLMLRLYEEGLR